MSFLDLPARPAKPRERGFTHVLDKGLSVAAIEGMMESAGEFIDIVKLGWGTAVVAQNLRAKLALYASFGVPVVLGGTLTEVALRDGRIDRMVAWLQELGIGHIEVSDGTIEMELERKCELISQLAEELVVLSEVGSKDAKAIMAPYMWVERIQAELEAGAWKVITEARESGNAGIYRADGEVRSGLIEEIAHEVDSTKMIFEAPRKEQQVWLLTYFGIDCNLGNIAPEEVLSLETLRLGLRSDTVGRIPADPPAGHGGRR